jgi:hypothetical protein
MMSSIYDFLSRFAWPLIWLSLVLALVDAFDDHSETTEQLKGSKGLRKYWLHTKRVRLWTLPIVLGVGAILAQMGSENDEAKIVSLEGRVITPEQQKIILTQLSNSDGLICFIINRNAPDSAVFAESLAKILAEAGYGVIPTFGSSTEIAPDVSVECDDSARADRIKDALAKAHIKINDGPAFDGGMMAMPPLSEGTIKIFIGIKSVDEN